MALRSTVYRAELGVADIDRAYYAEHSLTLARHPSETDERMMVRLLAFALFAAERLEFGRGLSSEDEADLWERDLTGAVTHWIDVGLPDPRDVRRACSKAARVSVLAYGRTASMWWDKATGDLQRFDHLEVWQLSVDDGAALAAQAAKTMEVRCTIQEGVLYWSGGGSDLQIQLQRLK
ncbi:MAG: YaeQ family protein [Moraxellaceae bacterium]|nr:YaeQ family protein [Moraxellaceae bacterium]